MKRQIQSGGKADKLKPLPKSTIPEKPFAVLTEEVKKVMQQQSSEKKE
jgi:hypothetical protein